MKRALVILTMAVGLATPALADGFKCQVVGEDLNVKVYNHVSSEEGTRNAAVMVLSNPTIGKGKRTIAIFRDVNETLTNSGSSYLAKVDLRFKDSGRKGEYIAGTRLGQIDTIALDVDFVYGADLLEKGDVVQAKGLITLRNGEEIELELDCERYLAQG